MIVTLRSCAQFRLQCFTFLSTSNTGPKVIKLFFMLNSTEHGILHADKSLITKKNHFFLLNITEHENFPVNKYENANFSWHFHIY